MIKWIWFTFILALLLVAGVVTQTRKVDAPVAPNALLYLVADTERELTRLPMAYTRIPDSQEIAIGDRIARYQQSELSDENKQIEAYVQAVGARVAANAHRKLPYRFHYIPERYFVNAFALPGGHVFIGAGLLELMENEDELASVLGHEIEHIDHYHCAERLQVEAALRKIPLGELAEIPIELFQIGYSKDQELEADREGTRLSVQAGYSPEGAIQVFTKFQKMEEQIQGKPKGPVSEMSDAAIQVLTGYFRSHPESSDRVAQIRALIAQNNWALAQPKPLEVRYVFLGYKAQDEVAAAHYDKAITSATESLKLHPGYAPALVALGKAKIASNDFEAAAAAYKELLAKYPSDADAIRSFIGDLITKARNAKRFPEAAKLAAFSLQLQPNNPEALQLLAQVDLELGDGKGALEVGQKLRKLYPDSGAQLLQAVNGMATTALQTHNYDRAARFLAYSLSLEPFQPEAQQQLAAAEFARADFRAAADANRRIIETALRQNDTVDPVVVRNYADSLGSLSLHGEAAHEFERLLKPLATDRSDLGSQIKIEDAGLLVMTGDESKARALTTSSADLQMFAPEHIARLGWWYYRAGKYDSAEQLLRRFLLQRPGDTGLQSTLGWVQLEKNAPADALHLFRSADLGQSPDVVRAGRAISRWRLRQSEPAMSAFDELSRSAPEWNNPAWAKSLYGPVATQSLQEMGSEQQRRVSARRGRSR